MSYFPLTVLSFLIIFFHCSSGDDLSNPCVNCDTCIATVPSDGIDCSLCARGVYEFWPCNEPDLCMCDKNVKPTKDCSSAVSKDGITLNSECKALCEDDNAAFDKLCMLERYTFASKVELLDNKCFTRNIFGYEADDPYTGAGPTPWAKIGTIIEKVESGQACQQKCQEDPTCYYWSWRADNVEFSTIQPNTCVLKTKEQVLSTYHIPMEPRPDEEANPGWTGQVSENDPLYHFYEYCNLGLRYSCLKGGFDCLRCPNLVCAFRSDVHVAGPKFCGQQTDDCHPIPTEYPDDSTTAETTSTERPTVTEETVKPDPWTITVEPITEETVEPDPWTITVEPVTVKPDPLTKPTHPETVKPDPLTKPTHPETVKPDPLTKPTHPETVKPDPLTKNTHPETVKPDPLTKPTHPETVKPDPLTKPTQPETTAAAATTDSPCDCDGDTTDTPCECGSDCNGDDTETPCDCDDDTEAPCDCDDCGDCVTTEAPCDCDDSDDATTEVPCKCHGNCDNVDVLFLEDNSYRSDALRETHDLANLKSNLRKKGFKHVHMGLASFVDKPLPPFGSWQSRDYCYKMHVPMTRRVGVVQEALRTLQPRSGKDLKENQLGALIEASKDEHVQWHSKNRVVVLVTDAGFHVAGDAKGLELSKHASKCASTDYPSVKQVMRALKRAKITPVFLVTGEVGHVYDKLVSEMGLGHVVSLDDKNAFTDGIADTLSK